jgi:hypothetical protein
MSGTLYNEINKSMEIKDLDDQVRYINDIAQELKELVNKQKSSIDKLEENTEISKENINDANKDITNVSNNKIWFGLTSGILLGSVIIGPQIMIPVGLATMGGIALIKKYRG